MKYKYNGQWYDLSCSLNVSNLLIGEIIEYAGESIPGGYLVCDGSAVSRTEYSELFDVIGTLYGSGDGSTTFNLPDLRGKVVTGLNANNSNFNVLGKTGGEETHTLTINEMPSHNHKMYSPASVTVAAGSNYGIPDLGISTTPTTNTGGDQPHNNLQPYITINYLIRAKKTKNVLASGSTVVNSLNGDSTVDAPSVHAVNDRQRGFAQYLGKDSITITPTIDVYANVEAVKSMWGYGGSEVGLKINTPSGATLISSYATRTNGHDTLGVPCLANYQYFLPAGGTYTFAMVTDGSQGGSMGNYIKAFTIPKID